MSWLSDLFSKPKPNLAPQITPLMPFQVNPQKYGELSGLSSDFIAGKGTGFGDQFVEKSSNPIASSMRRNFQNVTSPLLSNEYSKRGIARSNLAANAQGLAAGNVESDIGNLMAQFYTLNEAQKKTDQQFGANLGQTLLNNDVSQHNVQADASERLTNATAAQQNARSDRNSGLMMQGLATAAMGLGGPIGGAIGGGLSSALTGMGLGKFAGAMAPAGQAMQQGLSQLSPVRTRTLDDNQFGQLQTMLKSMGLI